ncbi:hypothetical protein SISSUDRAFT_1130812 [Sistotremastrum suecicum HHB10207 ss-3]|uniref:Uncharacterized protein n=1 Tax=Sistotremastrum suecicum HHB10207 ss-3 TaxID=1314776 RepID=A0A166AZ43_9AGAM|nr:hypothetical protein SISSUDRAFT_1130812 [Sistotremastrum suecicum HHB10207 ss-3]
MHPIHIVLSLVLLGLGAQSAPVPLSQITLLSNDLTLLSINNLESYLEIMSIRSSKSELSSKALIPRDPPAVEQERNHVTYRCLLNLPLCVVSGLLRSRERFDAQTDQT